MAYIYEEGKTNQGSYVVIKKVVENEGDIPRFQRMFLGFEASNEGFLKRYRSFLRIDGCNLKERFRRLLLSVVSIDANSEMFPMAFVVVEQENKQSWSWFFTYLKKFVGEGDPNTWTIMIDMQK